MKWKTDAYAALTKGNQALRGFSVKDAKGSYVPEVSSVFSDNIDVIYIVRFICGF